jgi:hypothetical protein
MPIKVISQILVVPTLVHLSDTKKTGHITVQNNSDKPREYEIEINFGYPVSDDSGNVSVKILDSISEKEPSAIKWVRLYPRRFVLQPGESQTVRIVARPPSGLVDGEYWARPSVLSKPSPGEQVSSNHGSNEISVNIGLEIKVFISLNYRKGKVNTGVTISDLLVNIGNNKLILLTSVKREGNAAYLGNIVMRLRNKAGEVIREILQDIAVYYSLMKKIELDVKGLQSGSYTVEVELNTRREEQGGIILPSAPVLISRAVLIP